VEKIPIKDVVVGSRYRKDFGEIDELANSLARLGQIQPIVLDETNNLIAGERRLRAASNLGWDEIAYVRIADLDAIGKKEIEIEENLRRKEFNWPEEVLALEELYHLKRDKYGPRIQGRQDNTGFGMKDAADLFDKSIGSIALDLELARAIREFPELAMEKTKNGAFKRYRRLKERGIREEIAKRLNATEDHFDRIFSPDKEAESEKTTETPLLLKVRSSKFKGYGILYNGDSRLVTRYWPSQFVDVIVTDPPYALGLFKEGQTTSGKRLAQHEGDMYDDDPFKVMDMLSQVFAHMANALKPNGHAYIFYHPTWYNEMYDMLRRAFDNQNSEASCVDPTPIIWAKNTSGIGDPNERWVYAYEPCFFINRGRPLVKPQAFNYLRYDTVPPTQKVHPTEKPTALLRHLISASAVKGEMVADPFAGSGSTLVAAVELGCKFYGVEMDPTHFLRVTDRLALTIGRVDQEGAKLESQEAEE
jgi:DNA modification methylase